ncbi:hypothetical protein [Streptomyces sp. NPDC026673]|uniref:hypothetical protein n=1 Tax=Streptomyces sp. NPDC026673 TaxID=3155724 RepID=UPI0033F8E37F
MATQTGTWQRWHVINRDGSALCGQSLNVKTPQTPDAVHEDYCRPCMNAVAAATAAGRT